MKEFGEREKSDGNLSALKIELCLVWLRPSYLFFIFLFRSLPHKADGGLESFFHSTVTSKSNLDSSRLAGSFPRVLSLNLVANHENEIQTRLCWG